MKKGDTVLPY